MSAGDGARAGSSAAATPSRCAAGAAAAEREARAAAPPRGIISVVAGARERNNPARRATPRANQRLYTVEALELSRKSRLFPFWSGSRPLDLVKLSG